MKMVREGWRERVKEKEGGRRRKREETKTSLISFIIIHISKVNSSDCCH